MIQFRYYPDRTVTIDLEGAGPEWENIPYSPYYFRVWSNGYGGVGTLEIKHEDDVDWDNED